MNRILVPLIVLWASGCVGADVHRLDSQLRPQHNADEVEVLTEAPEEPYTTIAEVEASTSTVFKGFEDLRRKVIEEAARLGGDAVIIGEESKQSGVLFTATAQIHTEEKKLTARVIVFPGLRR
jgi:hypothetical protein